MEGFMPYRICIVGLGLMGASFAYALTGFRAAELVGVDTDPEVLRKAVEKGAVAKVSGDLREFAPTADLTIFCVYPHHIPRLLKSCAGLWKNGAVLADICGVKSPLYEELTPLLPPEIDYVGIHPMAGKERDGFDNGEAAIFHGSGFLITPLPCTKPDSVALMREIAGHIGATKIAVANPEKHDEIIAYTSDLMHIAAACLCMDYHPDMTSAYTAGAFRDCTRIADINADAWTELLLTSGAPVIDRLDRYLQSLTQVRDALANQDAATLRDLLTMAGDKKREMLCR
jgi:prephenate dehydrogenase